MLRVCVCLFAAILLAACASRPDFVVLPSNQQAAHIEPVFFATTRALTEDGFSTGRTLAPSFAKYEISVPPDRTLGSLPQARGTPDAQQHFLVADARRFETQEQFENQLRSALALRPPDQREIVVYVHGYNTPLAQSVYRTAQLRFDYQVPGIGVHFSWPNAERATGYVHDRDSVLAARDPFAEFLKAIVAVSPGRVVLVAHSMGAYLAMETLRTLALLGDDDTINGLSGVVLMSPDLDIDVFRTQGGRIRTLPQPFIIFTSEDDRALAISARISNRPERLGNVGKPEDVAGLEVTIIDLSQFSNDDGDGLNHSIAASSPTMITIFRQAVEVHRSLDRPDEAAGELLPGTIETIQGATRIVLAPLNALAGN